MKRFNRNDSKSVIFMIFISVFSGLIASCILIILFSVLISKNDISSEIIKFFWLPITIIGAAVAGLISGRIVHIKGILSGVITSSVLSVFILAVLMFTNSFSLSYIAFLLVPVSVLFGTVCSIISANVR